MIFQEIGGQFIAVDSVENSPPTLADILSQLNIILDNNCQFCRIIRYKGKVKETIEYRAYGGRIRLNITQNENK